MLQTKVCPGLIKLQSDDRKTMFHWNTRLALSALLVLQTATSYGAPTSKGIVLYGQNFSFSVREPDRWISDSADGAKQVQANIIFFRRPADGRSVRPPIITLNAVPKSDASAQGHLKSDMNRFRAQVPGTTFKDFQVDHPRYQTASKIFVVQGKEHNYVTLVYSDGKTGLSISMRLPEGPADADTLAAYRDVVKSLRWLTDKVDLAN